MKKYALIALALTAAAPPPAPAPSEIVAAAPVADWAAIAASDLLVMELAPDGKGKPRRVVIQLMPPPFSQGWIGNIRKLAAAHWWDGTSVNRVQDNYVAQWGDATEKKALPKAQSNEEIVEDQIADFRKLHPRPTVKQLAKVRRQASEKLQVSKKPYPPAGSAGWFQSMPESEYLVRRTVSTAVDAAGHGEEVSFPRIIREIGKDAFGNSGFTSFGWPVSFDESDVWPVHCYGMVGVGRNLSPDTGTGAELYTVIGHAPRHLDRNIALVGRVIEGIEHLSSLPRGTEALGFYKSAEERVPILSIRLATELPAADQPRFEYLSTESASFVKYADARANRRDPFFIRPAGGADICNIPVPVRRVKG